MGFERCHPAVNFLFFAGVLAGCWAFSNPVYLALALLCAMAFYVERRGLRAVPVIAASLALGVAFALYYSSYHHFGVTVLSRNFIGNARTLESLVKGAILGGKLVCCILWLGCLHSVVTTDKIVYLFGRVSPMLALYLSGILRMVPRISRQSKKLDTARSAIGRGRGSGNVFSRINHFFSGVVGVDYLDPGSPGGPFRCGPEPGCFIKRPQGLLCLPVRQSGPGAGHLPVCLFEHDPVRRSPGPDRGQVRPLSALSAGDSPFLRWFYGLWGVLPAAHVA